MPAKEDLSGLTFLVVDANRHSRALLKSVLESFGLYNIVEAPDGAIALDILHNRRIDVILTGLAMPYLNGIELTLRVRHSRDLHNPGTPIILIADRADRDIVIAARNAGIHEFLVQPITAGAVIKHITKAVTEYRPFIRKDGYAGPARRWLGECGSTDTSSRRQSPLPPPRVLDMTRA
ncbi:MAG: response regulator [Rhodospirillales bacterium]|nr:response regulator [Rhodospirillales bacterium]